MQKMATKLRTMVILGSTRNAAPPWGGSKRLGDRVAKFLVNQLTRRDVVHEIDFVDLLEVRLPLLEQAFHWYAPGTAPKELQVLADRVAKADCYVLISPEYNHSMSPALANFLNHFGSSSYMYKPSAIATYSAGPFGGVRAAMQLRAITGELGCLSVSALFAAPSVQNSLDENGTPVGQTGTLLEGQAANLLKQLEWMADAMKKQRETVGIPK